MSSNLTVLHNEEVSDAAKPRRAARQILDLTLGKGLPWERIPAGCQSLIKEWHAALVGDWVSNEIVYLCRVPFCSGGCACRNAAVDHMTDLMLRGMFKTKLKQAAMSRWYKVGPCVRQVLLGIGCHHIWPRSAPRRIKMDDPNYQPEPDEHGGDDKWCRP